MRAVILMLGLLCGAVSSSAMADEPVPALQSLAWLLGTWERTGLPEGRSGSEQWQRQGVALVGRGASYTQGRLQFEESLRIEQDGAEVYYIADVPGNPMSVKFRKVEQAEHSVTFENPAHDFPQRITYRREGTQLTAILSGGGDSRMFRFEQSKSPTD